MEQTGIISVDFLSIAVWIVSILIFVLAIWFGSHSLKKRIMKDVEKLVDQKISERIDKN